MTRHSRPPMGACQTSCSACSLAAPTQKPASFSASSAAGRLGTWAMGRCSTAPADVLYAAVPTPAVRALGMTTPAAPTTSADRTMAPKLPSSVTWSSTTTRASPVPARAITSPSSAYAKGLVSSTMPWWAPWEDSASRRERGTNSVATPAACRRSTRDCRVASRPPSMVATSARLMGTPVSSASAEARLPSM